MRSIYSQYETSEDLEKNGIWYDSGAGKFLLRRAGGANADFARVFAIKTKKYQAQIKRGTLPPETDYKIMVEVFVDTIVVDWRDVIGRDGNTLEFSKENAVKLFTDLPSLFKDIRDCALEDRNYLSELGEEELKKSQTSSNIKTESEKTRKQ